MDNVARSPEKNTQDKNPQEFSSRPPEAPTDPSLVRSLWSTCLLLVERGPSYFVPMSNHPHRLAGIRVFVVREWATGTGPEVRELHYLEGRGSQTAQVGELEAVRAADFDVARLVRDLDYDRDVSNKLGLLGQAATLLRAVSSAGTGLMSGGLNLKEVIDRFLADHPLLTGSLQANVRAEANASESKHADDQPVGIVVRREWCAQLCRLLIRAMRRTRATTAADLVQCPMNTASASTRSLSVSTPSSSTPWQPWILTGCTMVPESAVVALARWVTPTRTRRTPLMRIAPRTACPGGTRRGLPTGSTTASLA